MNSITIQDGDAAVRGLAVLRRVALQRLQGCTAQINKYRNGTNKLRDEFGPDFWRRDEPVERRARAIPADGRTIDETDSCFHKRRRGSWYPATPAWTVRACSRTRPTIRRPTTRPTWELTFAADGRYRVEVFTEQRRRLIRRTTSSRTRSGTTDVVIDQAARQGSRSSASSTSRPASRSVSPRRQHRRAVRRERQDRHHVRRRQGLADDGAPGRRLGIRRSRCARRRQRRLFVDRRWLARARARAVRASRAARTSSSCRPLTVRIRRQVAL